MKNSKLSTIKLKKLFLKEYVKNLGRITDTCEDVGICRDTYYKWMLNDPKFKKNIEDIPLKTIKKERFEKSLIWLVDNHNPTATIFVNKALNKDLGYVESSDLNVKIDQEITFKFANREENNDIKDG